MAEIYLISDTHFGQENILKFITETGERVRPEFHSVEEMNEYMVNEWNRVITPQDHVYHLGDVYFRDGWKHLSRLNGKKRLLIGNHDNPKSEHILKNFQKIGLWRLFREHNILCTHVPIYPEHREYRRASVNVHGHIHEKVAPTKTHFNVSVERIGYRPRHIEEVAKKAHEGKQFKWSMNK